MEIIKRAVLHNTLLLGGSNLQMSLDTAKRPEMRLLNDEEKQMLYVFNKGEYAKLPHTAVAHMVPADGAALERLFHDMFNNPFKEAPKPEPAVNPMVNPPKGKPGPKPKFDPNMGQASSPHDHVFAHGPGKTRD